MSEGRRAQARARVGVLVSGSGTNLQAILDAVQGGSLHVEVSVVISNVAEARALERAARANVPTVVVDHRAHARREDFDAALVEVLARHAVDVVVLAGFMRVVTPVLLQAFPWRVINVHPALLPAFPGMHAARQALAYGVQVAGCTVHFVDSGTDTGPIIAQAAVPVLPDDDERTLAARIQAEEHRLLPQVLQAVSEGRVSVEEGAPRPRVRWAGGSSHGR